MQDLPLPLLFPQQSEQAQNDSQAEVLLDANRLSGPFLTLWTPESENYRS